VKITRLFFLVFAICAGGAVFVHEEASAKKTAGNAEKRIEQVFASFDTVAARGGLIN
jgi:hypothetical protein